MADIRVVLSISTLTNPLQTHHQHHLARPPLGFLHAEPLVGLAEIVDVLAEQFALLWDESVAVRQGLAQETEPINNLALYHDRQTFNGTANFRPG